LLQKHNLELSLTSGLKGSFKTPYGESEVNFWNPKFACITGLEEYRTTIGFTTLAEF